ncbi:MAG: potassium channel family protein [Acidimicrobiia bacterium]
MELLRTVRETWGHPAGRRVMLAFIGVIGVGTVFYKFVEGWSWVDSVYFTVVTLTTVGFGDLHPTQDISKVFTIVFILVGVGFILAVLNFLVTRTAQRRRSDGDTP